ncbi:cytochrome C554 [Actibacterium mucosum KCTC 23349]|uniref:Cytochrome C554 n=1 Tax=Actibacterium mucosum KCTC 23349 TaxID=1454373 RepID=A0A037ZPJ9_9RHOB|nr:cytochrome c [Actibacterium mucosum]KAJ56756.1 cytochrome C554 [Actibacterium mucosum KCTC 23349]
MFTKPKLIAAIASATIAAGTAFAGGHNASPEQQAAKARQAQMNLYGYNLGVLGAMAKGEAEFNADIAKGSAANLVALASMNQATYWPAGSDNASIEGTRALPAIWEKSDEVFGYANALIEAATALEAASGDLDGVRAALGGVGKACGDCHKAFRAPR